jgi:ATP-dependent RNA helicase DDX49/DBP8
MQLFERSNGLSKKRNISKTSASANDEDNLNLVGGDIDELHEEQAKIMKQQQLMEIRSFSDLGLCEWICKSASAMGFRRPFDIQRVCIPAILAGNDVMGCAETGSGKTAAFALPILQHLSQDPYGIFAIVLTPTRELAIQISEQFSALGAAMSVRTALVIGGQNMMEQGAALSRRPHIVIATPGRLRHHLESADPPNLGKALYIVLDEADRLLAAGFSSELQIILSKMHPQRKTLLFSATLTSSLTELEKLAGKSTVKFDLTSEQAVPEMLTQQYLFMPTQVKMCYLVAVLRCIIDRAEEALNTEDDSAALFRQHDKFKGKNKKQKSKSAQPSSQSKLLSSSIMIFVGTCRRCQEISEILLEVGIDCVALHSMMPQSRRIASLAKFKSHFCRIMVSTDVAGRGLDIPSVDLVINMDLPKIVTDYVHRVGRTARAGRSGRALSMVTQYDVELVHSIEEFTGQKLELSTEVSEDEVVNLLNPVSKAMRVAQLKLLEAGFEEKAEIFTKRRRKQRRQHLRKVASEVEN